MLTPRFTRISSLRRDSEKDSIQFGRNRPVRVDLRAIREKAARWALSANTRPRKERRLKSTPGPSRSDPTLEVTR